MGQRARQFFADVGLAQVGGVDGHARSIAGMGGANAPLAVAALSSAPPRARARGWPGTPRPARVPAPAAG